MGNIVELPSRKDDHVRLKRLAREHIPTYESLHGEKPRGHPTPRYRPDGTVILEFGQVWVDKENGRLWVVEDIERKPVENENIVTLVGYDNGRGSHGVHIGSEGRLRETKRVWDEVAREGFPDLTSPLEKFFLEEGSGTFVLDFE